MNLKHSISTKDVDDLAKYTKRTKLSGLRNRNDCQKKQLIHHQSWCDFRVLFSFSLFRFSFTFHVSFFKLDGKTRKSNCYFEGEYREFKCQSVI